MPDLLKNVPKQNRKGSGLGLLVCAALVGGAGLLYAKSARMELAAAFGLVAVLLAGFAGLLLKKSQQS